MLRIPAGTMVEVYRTRIVSQICIVESSNPLILRPATLREKMLHWFRQSRVKAGELAAADEALKVIERAKERA